MKSKPREKQDPEAGLGEILKLDINACNVTVCLASLGKHDDAPNFQRVQLSDDLTQEFRDLVMEVIAKRRKDASNDDLKLQPYNPGSKPESYEVEHLDLSEHDSIGKQIASLSSLADLEVFNGAKDFVSGLRFYAVALQCGKSNPLYCFRSYSQKKLLDRSPFFAALMTEGQFDRVREPLFLFDQHIDCICRGDILFVFNKDSFQKIFRFFEMVLRHAKTTLATIKTRVPISNFAEFEKACEGHLQMQIKLNNIAGKEYLSRVSVADIKKVMQEFPKLRVTIAKKDGKDMLVFDPADKWALLRLLDDDYLKSVMTGENYEVSGKRPY